MRLTRIRLGELLALVGALCVGVSLFLPAYQNAAGKLDVWSTFGAAVVLLMVAAAAALGLVLSALAERGAALPVSAAVWSTFLGIVAVVAGLVRVLERPGHSTSVCAGAWLALAGAAAILVGSWHAMSDERTSLYEPADLDPRPPPPPEERS